MSAHAFLSASASHRWILCPPSAKLNAEVSEKPSAFAEEGTLAHELGEIKLKLLTKEISKAKYNQILKKIKTSEYYCQEMEEFTDSYVDIVMEKYGEALSTTKDTIINIEERLNFSHIVPEGFGTGDVVIVSDRKLIICDLKYGKGVEVSAEENSQMMLYALGALEVYGDLYDIEDVEMCIIQPRLGNLSCWELSAGDLEGWAEEIVKPSAEKAFKGEGEFNPGDKQCRFCRIKDTCRARADYMLDFLDEFDYRPADIISNEEISKILDRADDTLKWIKEIQEYALDEALKGENFPGYKVVEGRSVRKITDEAEAIKKLEEKGYRPEETTNTKIKGFGDLEKLTGKSELPLILGDLIDKPQGKPVLVVLKDKRQPLDLTTIETEFDFE